eukprot:TRINITY_DN69799_c0_g1_i1.p3 TRINITY_DN69799_c0_g1~~TRINITY_DN69799_c0_g1_i1.p3  ORF type:complete len:122 (+),score=9.13 TRINITY_DN69799_c0_g1_i1:431-796(+)
MSAAHGAVFGRAWGCVLRANSRGEWTPVVQTGLHCRLALCPPVLCHDEASATSSQVAALRMQHGAAGCGQRRAVKVMGYHRCGGAERGEVAGVRVCALQSRGVCVAVAVVRVHVEGRCVWR